MFLLSFFSLLWALPNSTLLHYKDRITPHGKGNVLVVTSPGWNQSHYSPLLETLWRSGYSVWSLHFPLHAQHIDQMQAEFQQSLRRIQQPHVIFHALGGHLMLDQLPSYQNKIRSLSLLSVPIDLQCTEKTKSALRSPKERVHAFQRASQIFKQELERRCTHSSAPPKLPDTLQVWTATSNENTIAPPESIRFYIQDHHTFVRAGPLFLHWTEPHHEDFLTHTPTIKLLIQWLQKQ